MRCYDVVHCCSESRILSLCSIARFQHLLTDGDPETPDAEQSHRKSRVLSAVK
jgi:hypothetical protein